MVIVQTKSKRKSTGGRYKKTDPKRKAQIGRRPVLTKLAERKCTSVRTKGAGVKPRLLTENMVNVMDSKTNKVTKTEIKAVVENPANRHFVRRNILTKGTVVETSLGKAKITSRPGQDGTLNAVLV